MSSPGDHSVRRGRAATALASIVVVATAFAPFNPEGPALAPLRLLPVMFVAGVALLARQRSPLPVLAAVTVLGIVGAVLEPGDPIVVIPVAVAIYTVGRRCSRATLLWCASGLVVIITLLQGFLSVRRGVTFPALLVDGTVQPAIVIAFAAALGVAIQAQHEALQGAVDRARRAESSREAEADRRVAEERVAIARDLHDSVAHRISVINLHAALAARTIHTDPDAAVESVTVVGEAARGVIAEIRDMLWVLRSPSGPLPETVSLDERLTTLLTVFAGSGLRILVTRRGDLTSLDPAVAEVTYRVVQEALTNAYKHGDRKTATLTLDHTEDLMSVTVTNPVTGHPDVRAGGHGLQGIRERLDIVGGRLVTAAPRGNDFEVVTVMPAAGHPTRPAVADPASAGTA